MAAKAAKLVACSLASFQMVAIFCSDVKSRRKSAVITNAWGRRILNPYRRPPTNPARMAWSSSDRYMRVEIGSTKRQQQVQRCLCQNVTSTATKGNNPDNLFALSHPQKIHDDTGIRGTTPATHSLIHFVLPVVCITHVLYAKYKNWKSPRLFLMAIAFFSFKGRNMWLGKSCYPYSSQDIDQKFWAWLMRG